MILIIIYYIYIYIYIYIINFNIIIILLYIINKEYTGGITKYYSYSVHDIIEFLTVSQIYYIIYYYYPLY